MYSARRHFSLCCLLAIVACQAVAHGQTVPGGAPRAVAREIAHDFGPVEPGGTVSHTFTIRNAGTAPLRILSVDTSQPGMVARFTDLVAPGEAGRITVVWTPTGTTGPLSGEVVAHVSDPQRRRVTFTLTAVLRRSIGVLPSPDVFVTLYDDETAERRVTIVNNEERPLQITGLRSKGEHFTAAVAAVEPGRTYEVIVTVPPGLPSGRYVEELYVDTDHPLLGPVRLAVNTLVKDGLYANPEVIDFGHLSLATVLAGEAAPWLSQSSTLRKRRGHFAITSIESDVEGLRVNQSPAGRSSTFGLLVTLDRAHLRIGDLEGTIRITTDDKEFPLIVLPVQGRIR
jgi:hypothetical protein